MDSFLLHPETIRSLAITLLLSVGTGYLLTVRRKSSATWWLLAYTALFAVTYAARTTWTLLPRDGEFLEVYYAALVTYNLGAVLALTAFVQFAYRFLGTWTPREARAALSVCGAFVVGHGVYLSGLSWTDGGRMILVTESFWLAASAWALVVLLRKRRRLAVRPQAAADLPEGVTVGWSRRGLLVFASLAALEVIEEAITVFSGLAASTGGGALYEIVVVPMTFLFFSGLLIAYVHYAPEPTSVQVKLVGLSLAIVLLALLVPTFTNEDQVWSTVPTAVNRYTLRFTPDPAGGYGIEARPFTLDPEVGTPLRLGESDYETGALADTAVALGFAFPFYGRSWDEVIIFDDAALAFEPLVVPNGGDWFFGEDGQPTIALLWDDLRPSLGGGVFVRRDSARATITWQDVPRGDPAQNAAIVTLQAVLHADGALDLTYAGDPDAYAGTVVMAGLSPGGPPAEVERIDTGQGLPATSSPGAAVYDAVAVRSQRAMHSRMLPLAWALLGMTAFLLFVFPLLIRASVLRPIARLLDGVRRVGAGERNVSVPVHSRDEIGGLTRHVNAMTATLGDAEAGLRAYAQELEARVAERTAALEASTAELEASTLRLAELDELKTRFFANTSHELRTPLTLLLGPIEDALAPDADPETIRAQLPMMRRNAGRLLALVNQLLDLARLEAGGMHLRAQEVDLVPFVRQLARAFASRAERDGITLLVDADLDTLALHADSDKVEKVVTNLIANALKFTEPGGKVRVRLGERRDATGAWAEVVVQDTGHGIAPEEMPYIFDRFHRAPDGPGPRRDGTGLGLALVRELVGLHGGTVTVSSSEGFGSAFTVRLPLGTEHLAPDDVLESGGLIVTHPAAQAVSGTLPDDADDAEEQAEAEADARPQPGRPTVLVVEDNADLRAYLRSLLAAHYCVVEAENGVAGLAAARAEVPALILSDVMMPEMDGVALCRAIKDDPRLDHIPIVLLTARADDESRLDGLETGADDYLAKPFHADELLVRIENLITLRQRLRARFSDELVLSPTDVVVPSAEAAFLTSVRDAVEAHLGDAAFGVDALAAEVGMSARQLHRRLRDAADLSPGGFIRMMRLERAAHLLEQGAGSVAQVAYAVGYRDPNYFSRQFRQVVGQTASDYAAAHAV